MSNVKISTLSVYRQMWPYCRVFWLAFVFSVLGNLVYAGIDSSLTYLLKPILDKGFIAQNYTFLEWLPLMIIGLFLARGSANVLANYSTSKMSQGVIMNIQRNVFLHLQKMPAAYYDHNGSGQLLSVMIYNVNQMANVSATALVTFLQSFGMIVGLLIVMFTISWQLSLMYVVVLPIIGVLVTYSSKHVRRISHKLQNTMKDVISTAQENLEGYREIRAFGAVEFEAEKFTHFVDLNRQREMKNVVIRSITIVSTQLVAACVLALTAFIATRHHTGHILTAGGFISMIAAMLAILKPMKDLATVNNTIQRGVAGAEGVFSLLKMPGEPDEGKLEAKHLKGALSFKHLHFQYVSSNKSVLSDINFEIPAGKIVALVGHSGAGKSTLVQLLPRYYQEYEGQILVDGVDTREYSLSSLRKQFSIVSQHVVLFNDTIANNISYGDFEHPDRERVQEAARLAHALEFIDELPLGLDSFVGENGVRLSGGQRQRLAIARAIYKNAPILILDEATSALDTESERYIQEGLDVLMKNRTTIVIAHRLSTIIKADNIVVMDKGLVVESGRHEDLLAKNGEYANFYRLQFKDSADRS